MISNIATNSAPNSTNNPAEDRKARISQSTEWTGLRDSVTIKAEATVTIEKA